MTRNRPHISEEELAALIDCGLESDEVLTIRTHLTECRVCMAAYADTVRLRQQWLDKAGSTSTIRPRSRGRRTAGMILAACLPLVIAAGAWFFLSAQGGNLPIPRDKAELIQRAVTAYSQQGTILPGAAGAAWHIRQQTRGPVSFSDSTVIALDLLDQVPDNQITTEARILMISGYVATRDLDRARILTDNWLEEYPEVPEAHLLRGIVALEEGELPRAESCFRQALGLDGNLLEARFDLALSLAARGETGHASAIFRDLEQLDGYTLLRHRALGELQELED